MIHGYEHIHEEHVTIGPDGKPVRKVYTAMHELDEKQTAEMMAEHAALFRPFEAMFKGMEEAFGHMQETFQRMRERAEGRL